MPVHAGGIEWDYGHGPPLHASQHRRNGLSLPRNVNSFAFGRLLMLVIDPKHPISPHGSSPLARGKKRQLWRSASGVTVWLGQVGYLSEKWHLPNILPPGGVKQEHTPSSCDRELNIHLSAKTPACIPVSNQKLDCVARLCGRIGF